eukprot:TRINITY_DN10375_c0_g1_i1.p1 TRINITY_DN10375_c0_g1~~TRINITY_DN10375_c0_g1_i1.p1  ORF type:complete len:218 (+),score=37.33 TRINITY_DN10375_c0_g1_i1:107-760(+)
MSTDRVELKRLACSIWSAVASDPLYTTLEPVFYWRDVYRSGILFSIGNLFFFLITVGQYSLLTLVTYVFLTLMLVSYAYITFAQFRGQANPFEQHQYSSFVISKETLVGHANTVHKILDALTSFIYRSFSSRDPVASLWIAGQVLIISQVGKWFSGEVLLYLIFFAAFVWPRLYEEKKSEIDSLVATAVTTIQTQAGPLVAKLPPPVQKFLKNTKQD